jgi:hypothetical protein
MKLTYEISAQQTSHGDTAFRELVIEVNGYETSNKKYHYPINSFGEYTFNDGDEVMISLIELDGSNNEKLLTVLEFIASSDTVEDDCIFVKYVKSEQDQSLPNYKDQHVSRWKVNDDS